MSERLRLFPLKTVLFPGAVLNLHIFEPRYKQMIAECLQSGEMFGVVLIERGEEVDDPALVPHDVGTTAEIADVTELPRGRYYVSAVGRRRFRIDAIVSREPYLTVEVTYFQDVDAEHDAMETMASQVREQFGAYVALLIELAGASADYDLPLDPVGASYLVGDALQVSESLKQRLLELTDPLQRLRAELGFLRRLLPQLRTLVDRKREGGTPDAPADPTRGEQAKFFGKHFSTN